MSKSTPRPGVTDLFLEPVACGPSRRDALALEPLEVAPPPSRDCECCGDAFTSPARQKRHCDPCLREARAKRSKAWIVRKKNDPKWVEQERLRYQARDSDPAYRERRRAFMRARYAVQRLDPEWAEKERARKREYHDRMRRKLSTHPTDGGTE